jgi:cellulose synthase operon protein C
LKSFRKIAGVKRVVFAAALAALGIAGLLASARAELPQWIRNIEARSGLEAVFFRLMAVPGGAVMYRRPPAETRPALRQLIELQPKNAQLDSLLALEDEQQLDFASAEGDWKKFVEGSADKKSAELALADFYHRRQRPQDEIKVLAEIANAPADSSEKLTPPERQQSWLAFERIFGIIRSQGLPDGASIEYYRSWTARYPKEAWVYSRFLDFLISAKQYDAANQLIEDYRKQFPQDEIFPVKAEALVEYKRGSLERGLGVYEKTFQPLWDAELVKGYFDLLRRTQSLRKFLDEQRAALSANPEDLRATALVFYYYQQEGKLDAAQAEITKFRLHKEAAHSPWSSNELEVCAQLLEQIHEYPEAARYYFALYNAKGDGAQMRAIAGLARVLLDAPETPIRFGSGDLSMYRDIAAMDAGPGYLNGVLSLILNTTDPESEFSQEEQRAVPYFHRSRAAELLNLLDAKFPNSTDRPSLHAKLIGYYAGAGKSEAVIRAGKEFLAAFPQASERTAVALLMADAYAREGRPQDEFAIYDAVLKELAARADGVPLGNGVAGAQGGVAEEAYVPAAESGTGADIEAPEAAANEANYAAQTNRAFELSAAPARARRPGARSPEYARVLERYLARLTELNQIPRAIGVLRDEIQRDPDDPGLYERLAVFLEQNQLGAEEEEVYKQAMARFPDRSWYSKLARFYLRRREEAQFAELTQNVVKIFNGTELESYFRSVVDGRSPALYLQLNLYANQRFPHNPVFIDNLLNAYQRPQTRNQAAWEALLGQHWFEQEDWRNRYFSYLSASGQLRAELVSLEREAQAEGAQGFAQKNPAAGDYLAQAELWESHYEESAPLLRELAGEYPADPEAAHTASSVFRSLAYFDAADTDTAVKIEENLLAASPGNADLLARIGDTLADRELFARAAGYWNRIPQISPGDPNGYLNAATIYWDYFDFDNALRLLNEARTKFGDDELFAYEEGAIYEGERKYAEAVREYVNGSLAAGQGSPAEGRLLQLAERPQYRKLVDSETEARAEQPGASFKAIELRARVLETLNRKQELASLLDQALGRATTLEGAAEIESLAAQKSLGIVREHALEKEASLTSDPVTRLELRYSLVQLYESGKDLADAQKNVGELYRENPKILGVVRATVDFYWRVKLYPQAIAVLQQAAKDAYPGLGRQFTFEAARKSTEAKLYTQARAMLADLLKDSPYDPQYLAAMADTYAQSGDTEGLRQFYVSEIAAFRTAPLSADAKKSQIAVLRRGLIPALTKLQDSSGAVDQYIELINAFPEDEGLASEAALYAGRNRLAPRLVDYYAKTIQQSPRDYRWPMVLARVQTALEDFPAAIDAYAKAIVIRPDRVDLQIAQAGLEERLMRFDDAATAYRNVYGLAYKDPQWMEKVAEIRARQGRAADAVAALKAALIEGKPARPQNYFEAAQRLETWGMLDQARSFAEQGVQLAGDDLLASAENHSGAELYAHLMTRLRHPDVAYAKLQVALAAASAQLPVIEQQVATQGISAVTNSDWRERMRQNRMQSARSGMTAALARMGSTVAAYFTPEEKASFVQLAQEIRAPMSLPDMESFAIPLAQAAGLEDLEANWRYELMLDPGAAPQARFGRLQSYAQLERRRLRFDELARHIEPFAPHVPTASTASVLLEAADAYRSAGDTNDEFRVLSTVWPGYMGRDQLQRYFELLFERDPQRLAQTASQWTPWGQQAAQFVIANGSAELAHEVVAGRAETRNLVWRKAYDALTGLYFDEASPAVNASFVGALGDETIGQRMGQKLDRNQELAGDTWFYYGSRYGEYLDTVHQGDPDDFLPAELEQSPRSSSGYMQLADYYAEKGRVQEAIADYLHVLELSPGSIAAHDRLALAELKLGNRDEALRQWKSAFALLSAQVQSVSVPERFWVDFAQVSEHSGAQHLFGELRPGFDALLRAYLKKNGTYRSNELLRNAYVALQDPPAATRWLLDLSTAASDPAAVLVDVSDAPWIPIAQRAPVYQRILAAKQDALDRAAGFEKDSAQQALAEWQIRWANYLIETQQFGPAEDFLASLPEPTRTTYAPQLAPIELRAAAHFGTLDRILAGYRADEQNAPGEQALRAAATDLRKSADEAAARKILEFVFTREIDERHLLASNFLGLAEIRLKEGDLPGAMDLLKRLTVVVGDPFANLAPAADLLAKTGHPAEAAEFLEQLLKAEPWNLSAKARWDTQKIAANMDVLTARDDLAKIASDPAAAYRLRVEAALGWAGETAAAGQPSGRPASQGPNVNLGSRELNLLAAGPSRITPAVAQQAYFYDARIRAAQNIADLRIKVETLSAAVADWPSRDGVKYLLFEAAAGEHDDFLALAALEQTPVFLSRYSYEPRAAISPETFASSAQPEQQTQEALTPAIGPVLTRAWRSRLEVEAAQVLERLGRLNESVEHLKAAERLEENSARRKQINGRVVALEKEIARQRENEQRQPVLHQALEQDHVVRPRIPARVAASTQTGGQTP